MKHLVRRHLIAAGFCKGVSKKSRMRIIGELTNEIKYRTRIINQLEEEVQNRIKELELLIKKNAAKKVKVKKKNRTK